MSTPQEQLRQAVEAFYRSRIIPAHMDEPEYFNHSGFCDDLMQAIAPFVEGKDGARLDWLEANGANTHVTCWKGTGAEGNPWTIHWGDFADDKTIGEADTLRAALDAAMAGRDGK